jgi:glycosyltransferase involved in cell wall biosynthesis
MKKNICIITFPSDYGTLALVTPLSNLVKLIENLNTNVCLICGKILIDALKSKTKSSNLYGVTSFSANSNPFVRVINYLIIQFKISGRILAFLLNLKISSILFVFGAEILLLPIIITRLLGKKVIFLLGGSALEVYSAQKRSFSGVLKVLQTIGFCLADKIIVYSPNMVKKEVGRYKNKILITHEHFVDLTKFMTRKKINERMNIVGYIGRLSNEKGILNLIEAVPLVLKMIASTEFLICGKGDLSDKLKKIIKDKELEEHIKLDGWIPHEDLPRVLNELKLLVLPSYTEGLPNITLEAMACGTPVLATPVGAIPDVIRDGETGFLLESNNPKRIAERIVELLNKPELLEKVSINAYNYVRENFSYEKTLDAWRKIFLEL